MTCLEDPLKNLLNISLLYYCYSPLTTTKDLKKIAYMMTNMRMIMMLQWLMSMILSKDCVLKESVDEGLLTERRRILRSPVSNGCT